MQKNIHTVRLPEDLTIRLGNLAEMTQRTKSHFIREALNRTIEDLEDAYLAETAYEAFVKSSEPSIPIDEVKKSLNAGD